MHTAQSTVAAMIMAASAYTDAAELALHGGAMQTSMNPNLTYSWALEYKQSINDRFAGSFIWLNEGHIDGHHRDGQSVQFWWNTLPVEVGPVFEVGVGPYRFYDTQSMPDGSYTNRHGWGVLGSVGVKWYIGISMPNGLEPCTSIASK
jgi:hypothetical protein